MGADLYESYCGSILATAALGVSAAVSLGLGSTDAMKMLAAPMLLAGVGIFLSIVGIYLVKTTDNATMKQLMAALMRGVMGSSIMILVAAGGVCYLLLNGIEGVSWIGVWMAICVGMIAGLVIGKATEFYTSYDYKPTKEVAANAETGAATVIISGLAEGMKSTWMSLLTVIVAIILAYTLAGGSNSTLLGLYGVGIAAVGMLSTLGITLATDAYGPIADNAGGVAEMAQLGRDIRARTDKLDAVGNTTAAIGKGFAIGSAALTALALTAAFLTKMQGKVNIDAANPYVLVGLLIGCMLPFRFSAMAMVAVGKAAQDMIQEVRRQFRDIPELRPALEAAQRAESEEREPTAEEAAIIAAADGKAEYTQCVEISTSAAIKKMIAPGLMAVTVPVIVGLYSVDMLGGLLIGVTISGVCLAIFQANAGGALDNSKKQVKDEGHDKWGDDFDEMHKATVTGDTVGDPFKDTSGPSLNILIKLISVVAMIIAPILYAIHFG